MKYRSEEQCSWPGCQNKVFNLMYKVCQSHETAVYLSKKKTTCTFSTCDVKEFATGLCRRHYGQRLRGVELTMRWPGEAVGHATKCPGPECTRPIENFKRGLCSAHAQQERRGIDLKPLTNRYTEDGKICTECGEAKPPSEYYTKATKNLDKNGQVIRARTSKCKPCYIAEQLARHERRKRQLLGV